MVKADRGNPGVVDARTDDRARSQQGGKSVEVTHSLAQQMNRRSIDQGPDGCHCGAHWRRRVIDPRVGDDSEELVQTRPGDRTPAGGGDRRLECRGRCHVVRRVLAVGVDQQVRVESDHLDEPGAEANP